MPNQYTGPANTKIVSWDKLGRVRKRERLIEEAGFKCSQCCWDKRRSDGGCTLEVDHIDGNHKNNDKSNLRVLCPNCHSLTPHLEIGEERANESLLLGLEKAMLDMKRNTI